MNQTKHYRQYCFVRQIQHCKHGFYQDASSAGDVQDSKYTFRRSVMRIWIANSCSILWMRKKQTAVFHSSVESEVISLDRGLIMERVPVFQLWKSISESFRIPMVGEAPCAEVVNVILVLNFLISFLLIRLISFQNNISESSLQARLYIKEDRRSSHSHHDERLQCHFEARVENPPC